LLAFANKSKIENWWCRCRWWWYSAQWCSQSSQKL